MATMDFVRRVTLGRAQPREFSRFTTGDTINVHVRVKEGEKERIQVFKGVVIKIQNSGMGRSFTVRKMSSGVGVERTFPFASPAVDKVELVSRGKVRRSRLFYLRKLRGRAARLESELVYSTNGGKKAAGASKAEDAAPEAEETPSDSSDKA